jgi:hypothetical protein
LLICATDKNAQAWRPPIQTTSNPAARSVWTSHGVIGHRLDANIRGRSGVGPDRLRENIWGGRALAAPNLPSARIGDEQMAQNLRYIQTDKQQHRAPPDVQSLTRSGEQLRLPQTVRSYPRFSYVQR